MTESSAVGTEAPVTGMPVTGMPVPGIPVSAGAARRGPTLAASITGASALSGRLARSSLLAFGIHVGGAGLTYCSQLLIARTIGAEGYGVYAYVFAWMTVLAYLVALGFDVSLLRFIPAYQAEGAWPLLRGVIRQAQRWAMIVGAIVVLGGIAVITQLEGARSPALTRCFIAGFFLVPVLALLWIRSSIVRAFGGVVTALAPDRMVRDGILLVIIGIAGLLMGLHLDAAAVMVATLASATVGLGLVSLAMRRWVPDTVRAATPERARRVWARAALPLVIIGGAEVATNRMGVVLLGWVGLTTDAGIYALAFNIAFLSALPRAAVNALFAPAISRLFVRKDLAALQALATQTAIWTLLGAICIALPLALLAEPLLSWFGPGFAAGATPLRWLLLGQVVTAGAGSQLYLLTMTGHEKTAAVLMLLNAAVNAVLCAVLIQSFGLTGAAIGSAITLILWNLAMAVTIWRVLHLMPSALSVFASSSAKHGGRP